MRNSALLIGRQGAGKGTVGRLIEKEGALRFLSAGDVLRAASRVEGERGAQLGASLEEGCGADPDDSYALVARALDDLPPGDVLLDGCPRRRGEVDRVRALFAAEPLLVVELQVPLPIAVARIRQRLTCIDCQAPHGSVLTPLDGRCRTCQGPLERREDDTWGALRRRLAVWDVEGRKIVRYYESRTTVVQIDATREPGAVAAEIIDRIRSVALRTMDDPS